jgi:haloacetate dehalogenase
MAKDLVELMLALGFDHFAVVGHDRGARVAYRMALDHPANVDRLVVLNVIPTVEQFERMGARSSLGYWPWFLLAQPAPFPEVLIAAEPEHFLRSIFNSWAAEPGAIDEEAFGEYLRAFTETTIASMCADYRASFWIDQHEDAADRRAGRRIECPVLLITGQEEAQLADAESVWRAWAPDLRATTLPGGHFLPEEAKQPLANALVGFLGPSAAHG